MSNNPFHAQIYDRCQGKGCTGKTQHKSGLCEKCRQRKCSVCGVEFTAAQSWALAKPLCGLCKIRRKKPA